MVMYVITGGPGTGKTTLINELSRIGYPIVPEVARQIIEEEQKKENGILPWSDLYTFQQRVVQRQVDLEARVRGDITFVDRGIVDNLAYCHIGGIVVPPELERIHFKDRYKNVFVLDFLPNYENDIQRTEDISLAKRIHATLQIVYEKVGYNPVLVPVMELEQRVAYVLDTIKTMR